MAPWRRESDGNGWFIHCTKDNKDLQVLGRVNVQPEFMPAQRLSRASRKILLTTSIRSAILLVFAFFLCYLITLFFVYRPFQKAKSKQGLFPGMSVNHGRPKVKFLGRAIGFRNGSSLRFSSDFHKRRRVWDPKLFDVAASETPDCKGDSLFIVMITSSPDHFEHRREVRNTWCNLKQFELETESPWQCLFLIGNTNDSNTDRKLKQENQIHRDILRGNYVDSYRNLTYKVIHGFTWIKWNCEVPYVLKTDDDCFVNTLLFRQFLLYHNTQTADLYAGHMLVNENTRKVIRGLDSKWSVSIDDYSQEYYPIYASGSGYALSTDVLAKVVEESQFHKPISNEDAYVGIVINTLGIQPTLSGRFILASAGLHLCNYMYVFVVHGVEPIMHQDMTKTSLIAQTKCHKKEAVTDWF